MNPLVRLLPLVAAAALSACGTGDADDGVATAGGGTSPRASLSPEDAAVKFARCMREHGVEVPDPGDDGMVVIGPGQGGSAQDVAEPVEACRQYAPGLGPSGGQMSQEDQDRMLAFARCMREQGVDVPDPQPGGGVQIPLGDGLEPGDPRLKKAQEACREFFGPVGVAPGGAS